MRRDTGGLANEAFTSNPIVSLKQYLSGLKTTNCTDYLFMSSDQFSNGLQLLNQKLNKLRHEKSKLCFFIVESMSKMAIFI